MNFRRLQQAEDAFFDRYPGGFANPEMIAIRKKHQLEKMVELTQESFVKRNFKLPDLIVQNMVKIITRSSLISVFEKPRFRDFAISLPQRTGTCSPKAWRNSCMATSSLDLKTCW